MELEFMKTDVEYLEPVFRDIRMAEETAEAIVPDACPDAAEVLFTSGLAFLRGKELGEGELALSAGVSATTLLKVEGRERPEVIEVYIPMTMKLKQDGIHSDQSCRIWVELRQVDSHLVNPRKVLVRATVAVYVWCYQREKQEHLTKCLSKDVEVLEEVAPIRCLKALGEKNYTVEDRVSVGGNGTALGGCQVELEHQEARLTGTRAVLRGVAKLQLLCLDEDGTPYGTQAQVPFSQYIDLDDCLETDQLQLRSLLTGADISPEGEGSFNVTLQITTTAEVWGTTEIPYIGDIYSVTGLVTPEVESRCYDSLLDRQLFSPTGQGGMEQLGSELIFAFPTAGEISVGRREELVELTLPVTLHLLSRGQAGTLQGETCRVELKAATQAGKQCRFEASTGEIRTEMGQEGGLNVQVSCTLGLSTFGALAFQEITGGQLSEDRDANTGPGLIIRRPKPGESLWDMAKQYRTTRQNILSANGLEETGVGEAMLLIPRGR